MTIRLPWLRRSRNGAVSVEYAVVIGTLSAAIIAAFSGLGTKLLAALNLLPI